jgi:bla regulator protein BlaR1
MSAQYLSRIWTAIAPPLGNHLWQSTVFAICAGLLTLILRKNHARARYWLWLAASIKFLVPFSLLVALGSQIPWSRGSATTNTGWFFAIEPVSQPFTPPAIPLRTASPATAFPNFIHLLPALLIAAWLCGFVVVLAVWYARWRRISAAIRESALLREGREVEALRRLQSAGRTQPIKMLL